MNRDLNYSGQIQSMQTIQIHRTWEEIKQRYNSCHITIKMSVFCSQNIYILLFDIFKNISFYS